MVDNIMDPIKKETNETLIFVEEKNFEQLKQAARQFITFVLRRVEKQEQIKSILEKETISESLVSVWNWMREDDKNTQQLVNLEHDFAKRIDSFLGRTILLTYVTSDGEILFADQEQIKNFYNNFVKIDNKNYRGKVLLNKEDQIKNYFQKSINQKIKQQIEKKQITYQIVLKRYERKLPKKELPKNQKKMQNKIWYYTKQGSQGFQWGRKKIPSRGWIAEGYMEMIIKEDPDIPSNIDFGINLFYQRYLRNRQKNNIAGIIKGDVTDPNNLKIQYAVKSQTMFGTQSINASLAVAYNILQEPELTPKQLEKKLKSFSRFPTKKIIEKGEQEFKKYFQI